MLNSKGKKKGKDQESIRPSTIPDMSFSYIKMFILT